MQTTEMGEDCFAVEIVLQRPKRMDKRLNLGLEVRYLVKMKVDVKGVVVLSGLIFSHYGVGMYAP